MKGYDPALGDPEFRPQGFQHDRLTSIQLVGCLEEFKPERLGADRLAIVEEC
jgi:hypothetical protein